MTTKKRDLSDWNPADEREKGRALIPGDFEGSVHNAHTKTGARKAADAPREPHEMDGPPTSATALAARDAFGAAVEAALIKTLPGYEQRKWLGRLPVFVDTFNILSDFLADHMADSTSPRAGESRANLAALSDALSALLKAWDAADVRAKEIVYLVLGEGDAGARRMHDFRDTARQIDDGIVRATAQRKAGEPVRVGELPYRDARVAPYDGLIRQLAELYSAFTGRPLTAGAKEHGVLQFIKTVTETLPKHKPTARMISLSVGQAVREKRAHREKSGREQNKTSP